MDLRENLVQKVMVEATGVGDIVMIVVVVVVVGGAQDELELFFFVTCFQVSALSLTQS